MDRRSFCLKILVVAPAALSLLAAVAAAQPDHVPSGAPPDQNPIAGREAQISRHGKPIGLRITLCLWTKERPAPLCRDVPLTPGAAGQGFEDNATCEAGKERALNDWFEQAREVFGFNTGWTGEGYQIKAPRCADSID